MSQNSQKLTPLEMTITKKTNFLFIADLKTCRIY